MAKSAGRPTDIILSQQRPGGSDQYKNKKPLWENAGPSVSSGENQTPLIPGAKTALDDSSITPSEKNVNKDAESTSPRVQKLTDILASLDNLTGREEASAIDKMISGELYEEIKPYDSHLAYKLMKKGEDGIPALLALNSGNKSNKDVIYQSQANEFKTTLQEAIDLLTTKDAERARLAQEMDPAAVQPAPKAVTEPAGPVPMLLGEKIGGARKDLETTGTTAKPKKTASTVPAWRRRYIVSQIVNRDSKHFEKWSILDDTTGRLLVRKFFDTAAEAEALLPLAVFGVKHRVRKGSDGTWGCQQQRRDRKSKAIQGLISACPLKS